MSSTSSDVELRIRARDESSKTLQQLAKAVKAAADALDQQTRAAETNQTSAKELEDAYKKLESAGQALIKQSKLVQTYQQQSEAMATMAGNVEAAKKRYEELSTAMAAAEKVTKKQQTALTSAQNAIVKAENALAKQEERVTKTAASLEKFGISTKDLAGAQATIVSNVNKTNAVLEELDVVMTTGIQIGKQYAQEQAAIAAAQAEAAAAAKTTADAQKAAEDAKAAEAAKAAAQIQSAMESEALAMDKVITKLRNQANELDATAAGYKTLGNVTKGIDLGGTLVNDLQAIINPAAAARANINTLETSVNKLSSEIEANVGVMDDYAATTKSMSDNQSAILNIAKLIDKFKSQVAAIREARTEFQAVKSDIRDLADQMRSSTSGTEEFGAQMQQLKQQASASASTLQQLGTAARATQAALLAAGVNTQNLSAEESRLRSMTTQTATSLEEMAAAAQDSGTKFKGITAALNDFMGGGRTTLSLAQRMKGEILALGAAYVGLYGQITMAGDVIDAYKLRQQTMIKLAQVVGNDLSAQQKEWQYTENVADQLGLRLDVVADEYSKFAIAATTAGMSLNDTKFIFENVSKAARVNHISIEDLKGVYLALSQMIGKGQVYSEELRQQLGERLPQAISVLAKERKQSVAELLKDIQNGEVKTEAVIQLAKGLGDSVAGSLEESYKSVDKAEGDAYNAFLKFKLAMADSGFIDSYTQALQKLTDFLNSSKGQEAAQKWGDVLADVTDGLIYMLENLEAITTASETLLALWATAKIVTMVTSAVTLFKEWVPRIAACVTALSDFTAMAGAAVTGLLEMSPAIAAVAAAVPQIAAALAAAGVAVWAYNNIDAFHDFVDDLTTEAAKMGLAIEAIFKEAGAAVYDLLKDIFGDFASMLLNVLASAEEALAQFAAKIPGVGQTIADSLNNMAKTARSAADDIAVSQEDAFSTVKGVWNQYESDWNALNNSVEKRHKEAMSTLVAQNSSAIDTMIKQNQKGAASWSDFAKAASDTTISPNITKDQVSASNWAGMFDKTQKQASGFQWTQPDTKISGAESQQIAALTADIQKAQKAAETAIQSAKKALVKNDLPGQLKLIDEQFKPLYDKASAIGGATGAAMAKQLDAVVSKQKQAATMEFNAKGTKSAKDYTNQVQQAAQTLQQWSDQLRANKSEMVGQVNTTASVDAAVDAVVKKYEKLIDALEKLKIKGNAALSSQRDQLVKNLQSLEQQEVAYTKQKTTIDAVTDSIKKAQELEDTRNKLVDSYVKLNEAGQMSEQDMINNSAKAMQEYETRIKAAIKAAEDLVAAHKDAFTPDQLAEMNDQIAQLKLGLANTSGQFTELQKVGVNSIVNGINTALEDTGDLIANLIEGTSNWRDAWTTLGSIVGNFFASLLKDLALAIAKQAVLNSLAASSDSGIANVAKQLGGSAAGATGGNWLTSAANGIASLFGFSSKSSKDASAKTADSAQSGGFISSLSSMFSSAFATGGTVMKTISSSLSSMFSSIFSSGSGIFSTIGNFFSSLFSSSTSTATSSAGSAAGGSGLLSSAASFISSMFHNGGTVGSSTSGSGQQSKSVSPSVFAGAKRFHTGGFPGLKSDEVPAILQKGEQVLSKSDPNNALNGGGSSGSSSSGSSSTRIVLVDDRDSVPEAMNSSYGEKIIMQQVRRNKLSIKKLAKA